MNFEPMNFYEFLETSKNERLLNEFYSISNINFDFDKVSAFLKDQVPDLELFLKIENLSFPKSIQISPSMAEISITLKPS